VHHPQIAVAQTGAIGGKIVHAARSQSTARDTGARN
jgi:hypothetical protein